MYISRSGVESSFCILYTSLAFQQMYIQNPFKHLRWSVFGYPVNDFKMSTVCTKHSILNACLGSEYACVQIAPGNVLCHHNKYLLSVGLFRIPTWLEDNLPSFE